MRCYRVQVIHAGATAWSDTWWGVPQELRTNTSSQPPPPISLDQAREGHRKAKEYRRSLKLRIVHFEVPQP
jgi:hypothetical protein